MSGFVLPPYPYDRLDELRLLADRFPGGCVDLSVGTPTDPPPAAVVEALASSGAERGYPPSIGTAAFREAAVGWMARRFGVEVDAGLVRACIGTKELVAGLPHLLRLRSPERDTVLYPAISYPSYAMGASLAGCRAVPVTTLAEVSPEDADRALCLWVNSPANPTGALDDLDAAARWGRDRAVPVFSDECYAEFTWAGPPRTILEHGIDGLVAVHSVSKGFNLAGVRAGFYVGDPELVTFLGEVRKHGGFMVPGPVQAAAAVALLDDDHVAAQRERYRRRLARGVELFGGSMPDGAFYLWVPSPGRDGWALTTQLAERLGVLVSPGEFYGPAGSDHVRIAMVRPDDQLELVAERLAAAEAAGR